MKRVLLIGAGNIGSRHLQALKAVKEPLDISVVEPNKESREKARAAFDSAKPEKSPHCVSFYEHIPNNTESIDLCIVATTSKDRRSAIEHVLENRKVQYFLLEKLLFDRKEDYRTVAELFKKNNVRAWVNCTMRTIPFYAEMKKDGLLKKINYTVGSGETGLVTSIVHFLDHMAYLTECLDFTVDTSLIDPTPIESKRKGFIDLIGTIRVTFADGSTGSFTRYPSGTEPSLITVTDEDVAYIIRETEEKTWVSKKKNGWKWNEVASPIPYQSVMTTWLVEEILREGKCRAVTFQDSSKIHLQILEPLRQFLNANGGNYDYFPFT